MKKLIGILCVCASFVGNAQSSLDATDKRDFYMNSITVKELKEQLFILAADEYEGRETSKPGQKKAAAYIENYYESLGLEKGSMIGVQQQSFPLRKRKLTSTILTVNGKNYESSKDIFSLDAEGLEGTKTFTKIVFAGYGITEGRYNDYEGLDVKDALVVVMDGEPKNKKGKSLISGDSEQLSDWSYDPGLKVALAQQNGAKAIVVIRRDYATFLPRIKFWLESEKMELIEDMDVAVATGIPLIFTNEKSANEWFRLDLANNMGKFSKKGQKIPHSKQRVKLNIVYTEASLNVSVTDEMVSSENVLAFIEGSDATLKNEIVVVSAHYDHIGIVNGEINNGADDDGSGTVSAMEIAEAFIQAKKDGNGPKRSVLILHVSGEEKGLFGSDYYTRHPVYPLNNTVCDLNIDMIGRVDEAHKDNEKYVYLIGSDRLSMDLHNLSESVNKQTSNLILDYTFNAEDDPNQFYYRSDHYNFAKNNIPVIFYFSGVHEDYHKPGDDPEKILYDKMCSIAQLVFSTAWEIANQPERLKVKN
jgi:hypothetical protein